MSENEKTEKKVSMCVTIGGDNSEILDKLRAIDQRFYEAWLDSRMADDDTDHDSRCSGQVEIQTLDELRRLLCGFYVPDCSVLVREGKLPHDIEIGLWASYSDKDLATGVGLVSGERDKVIGTQALLGGNADSPSILAAAIEARDTLVAATEGRGLNGEIE